MIKKSRNPSELRGPCKFLFQFIKIVIFSRNPSELRGPCKRGPHLRGRRRRS